MIHNATYKTINGESFIDGFETEKPLVRGIDPDYQHWLATKKTWKIKDAGQLEQELFATDKFNFVVDFEQDKLVGIPIPKSISDRIELFSVDESYRCIYPKTPIMKFVQYAILNPTIKESLQVDESEDELLTFAKFLLDCSYVRGAYKPETLVRLFKTFLKNNNTKINDMKNVLMKHIKSSYFIK